MPAGALDEAADGDSSGAESEAEAEVEASGSAESSSFCCLTSLISRGRGSGDTLGLSLAEEAIVDEDKIDGLRRG